MFSMQWLYMVNLEKVLYLCQMSRFKQETLENKLYSVSAKILVNFINIIYLWFIKS